MSIRLESKKECCGCTACENICAHNAITMQCDTLGFQYPVVDHDKCVECSLCEKVCQFHSCYSRYDNFDNPKVYALRLKDSAQLMRSQSGGAFWGIAKGVIDNNGVVYGAAFDNDWNVIHQRATNADELESLRMSKYVQSDLRGVFKQVKGDLKQGLTVLFSGTACQVAGLKSYVPLKLHQNLFCLDIVCHGVPSPQIWKDYVNYLEDSNKAKIVKACFRDKRFGWHGAKETFLFDDGREIVRQTSNYMYFSGISIRESCANCKFTNMERVGDVTAGDFWGIPKDSPYEKDKKGLSLLLVNSEKGRMMFDSIKEKYIVEESNVRDCLQPQLQYPSEMSPLHEMFVHEYSKLGFLYVAKKYGDMGWRYKTRSAYMLLRASCGIFLRKIGLKK